MLKIKFILYFDRGKERILIFDNEPIWKVIRYTTLDFVTSLPIALIVFYYASEVRGTNR